MRGGVPIWAVGGLLIALVLTGCEHGSAGNLPATPVGRAAVPAIPGSGGVPAAGELEQELAKAFGSLGIDPDKVAAKAPTGADNAVFNLAASLVDPDGAGGNPPTGVSLTWMERMLGDYDANGEVGYPDLTALAQNWLTRATYDDPALHGGLAYWPIGDADDGGTGAANWALARVDGDGNTEIGYGDVVTIAEHWNESLAGYRVYGKAPGDTEYTLLDSIAKTSQTAPVLYSVDSPVSTTGVYSYYVAPYDTSNAEGTASTVVSIDTDTGVVNHAPVAALKVTPGFAGAPAVITLDASESYDVDGSITAFAWDFDADGVDDWVSTDAPPEQSSTGLVYSITPGGAPGTVTAQYTRGSAEWYYPRVTVTDNQAAEGPPATAKLGISGWKHEEVSNETDTLLNFHIQSLEIDPGTGELVAAGAVDKYNHKQWEYTGDPYDPYGVYFGWRHAEGDWTAERVFNPHAPEWNLDFWHIYAEDIFWMPNGQPGVVVQAKGFTSFNRMYVSVRQSGGSWDTQLLWGGADGNSDATYTGGLD